MRTAKWILKRLDSPEEVVLTGQEEFLLGRSKDSYYAILSLCVSRRHCIFRITENGLTVKDLNSANGTFVNEKKIPPMIDFSVKSSDLIGIGVPQALGPDTFVFTLLNNEEKKSDVANNIVDLTTRHEPTQEENRKSFITGSSSCKSEPVESEEDDDVLLIEEREKIDIVDVSEYTKDDIVASRNDVSTAISALSSQTSPDVGTNSRSKPINFKKEIPCSTRRKTTEVPLTISEQNNVPSEETNLKTEGLNVDHSLGNIGFHGIDCVHDGKIEAGKQTFSFVEKCAVENKLRSGTRGPDQSVLKTEKSSPNKQTCTTNNIKQTSDITCSEDRKLNDLRYLDTGSFVKEKEKKRENMKDDNRKNIIGENKNIKKDNNSSCVKKEKEDLISNEIIRHKRMKSNDTSFEIATDAQLKKGIVGGNESPEIMKNTSETLKQKDEINIDSLSRKVDGMDKALKRLRKELAPNITVNKSDGPASKKLKLISDSSSDLSNSNCSSCSADGKNLEVDSPLQSSSGDENLDKWFANVCVPFLEKLETTETIPKTSNPKGTEIESRAADTFRLKTKTTDEDKLRCEEEYYKKTLALKKYPVVVVQRLENINKNQNYKKSTPEKGLDRDFIKNNSCKKSVELSSSTSVSSEDNSRDLNSEMESQNHLSSIINYSQSDDVIVIDDDDDDNDDNNLEKETKNDLSHNKGKTEECKSDYEETCVKEEIFDDGDDEPEDDEDDELEIINWMSKLSQTLSPPKEENPSLCTSTRKKQRILISDSSDEDLPPPVAKHSHTDKVIKNSETVVDLTDEKTDHFPSKKGNCEISSHLPLKDINEKASRHKKTNKTVKLVIDNEQDESDDSIFNFSKSNKHKRKNVTSVDNSSICEDNEVLNQSGKELLSCLDDQRSCDERDSNSCETSLEGYAENNFEDILLKQKDKEPRKANNISEEMTCQEKVPYSRSDRTTININQPGNRRTTLLDCALPMKPKSRKAGKNKNMDSGVQSTSKDLQSSNTTSGKSYRDKSKIVLDSRIHSSSNVLSESERKNRVKEDRRAKLKALIAQKTEVKTADNTEVKVPSKSTYRPKNTILSRADKLAESLTVSNQSSKSKKEKIKVTVIVKKNEVNKVLKPANVLSTVEEISNSDEASHRDKTIDNVTVPSASVPSAVIPANTLKRSEAFEENPSVSKLVHQVRKLSFKDLPKIPKYKPSDCSSVKPPTCDRRESAKPMKEKNPLRTSLKSVASHRNKSVSFAPEESLCTVHSFQIAAGNTLHRVEGKDAPVRKMFADQAETLYDSSRMVLNRVITLILQFWNPRWIVEEIVIAQKGGEPPPAHCQKTAVSTLCPMLTAFSNYEEYWKIVEPLMMLDLWARVSEDARRPNERSNSKYDISVNDVKEANGILTLSCSMTISAKQDKEKMHPLVGDLCVIRYPVWSSTYTPKNMNNDLFQQEKYIERFAYVESLNRDYFRSGNWNQGNSSGSTEHCKLNFAIKVKGETQSAIIHPTLKVISSIRSELRQFEAVGFLQHSRLCKMILNPSVSDYKLKSIKSSSKLVTKDNLNDTQKHAILKCASICSHHSPKICLIQGPPGTGKTKVIVNIILQILYANDQYSKQRWDKRTRILLCAPSNAAADEMVERLLVVRSEMPKELRFKMVRAGPKECLREKVRGVSVDELAKKEVGSSLAYQMCSLESVQIEISTLEARRTSYIMAFECAAAKKENTAMYEKRIRETEQRIAELKAPSRNKPSPKTSEMEREARKKILSFADIVVSTLSSSFNSQMTEVFASRSGRSNARFTCCIIDEATQSKEPECLIPFMYGIEKIIMVGDPEQLPATVLSQVAKEKSMGQPLFNRIWNKFQNEAENPVIFLDTQYRMHPDIYKWPNTYIYHGKVRSDRTVHFQTPFKPYCVFAHCFHQNSQFLMNLDEVELVINIAKTIAHEFPEHLKNIGIITPYQKQLQKIKSRIAESRFNITILANTIDGFQGRECDIIIFSCVRTRGLGFMGESQRLNVALTRARYCLIICGNFVSLQDDRMWSSLLADAMKRNLMIAVQNVHFNQNFLRNSLLRP